MLHLQAVCYVSWFMLLSLINLLYFIVNLIVLFSDVRFFWSIVWCSRLPGFCSADHFSFAFWLLIFIFRFLQSTVGIQLAVLGWLKFNTCIAFDLCLEYFNGCHCFYPAIRLSLSQFLFRLYFPLDWHNTFPRCMLYWMLSIMIFYKSDKLYLDLLFTDSSNVVLILVRDVQHSYTETRTVTIQLR